MKEIKFRAWSKKHNYMFAGSTLSEMLNDPPILNDLDVMQYTGLKDRNGKEIYEGDICRDNKTSVVIVEWNDENFGFSCKIIKGGTLSKGLRFPLWQWDECAMNGYRYLEVIGNIYDNPELLETCQ